MPIRVFNQGLLLKLLMQVLVILQYKGRKNATDNHDTGC